MLKYIAYYRKSTDESQRQVLSIDAQISELKEFSQKNKIKVVETITEAKTAKSPGREQFEQMLNKIEKGKANGILSWHPDRLARNSIDGGKIIYLLDTGQLLDLKFPNFWFENTPQGKFMLSIAFGQSKYYVDNLSENVKRGIREKLRRGIWPRQAHYGYVNNPTTKTIDVDPKKSKVIKKAFELFAKGKKSFTQICEFLYEEGITKKDGRILHVNQARSILTNTFYIGKFKYNGEWYKGSHKCFISKRLFEDVQKQIERIARPRKQGHNFAFVGLARCGECGAAITGESHTKFYKGTNREATYVYYRCTKKLTPCKQKYVNQQNLESQLRKIVSDAGVPVSVATKWLARTDQDEVKEKQNSVQKIQTIKKEIDVLENKLNILLDSYLEGIVDPESYKKKKNEFFEKKLALEEEKSKIETNGASWLEPLRECIYEATNVAKIARRENNCHDLAIVAKKVGSNFVLKNTQLKVEYNTGFAELAATASAAKNSRWAGPPGFEPGTAILEIAMIPFHHGPKKLNIICQVLIKSLDLSRSIRRIVAYSNTTWVAIPNSFSCVWFAIAFIKLFEGNVSNFGPVIFLFGVFVIFMNVNIGS